MYKLTAILKTGSKWVFTSPIYADLPRIARSIGAVSYEITDKAGNIVITEV